MIQLYFREFRRRVQRLEHSRRKPLIEHEIAWVDDDGTVTMIAGPNGLWEIDDEQTEEPEVCSSGRERLRASGGSAILGQLL
jgi:hypothetical protein